MRSQVYEIFPSLKAKKMSKNMEVNKLYEKDLSDRIKGSISIGSERRVRHHSNFYHFSASVQPASS